MIDMIDNQSPIYRQIIKKITGDIHSGALQAGDRLPTERELAQELNIARGTVKKAYLELERQKLIEVRQGSGSFVLPAEEPFIPAKVRSEEKNADCIRVAFVDCNLDSLALFKQQLEPIEGKTLSLFLLDAVKLDDDPEALLAGYDLVLTTFSHYEELSAILPNCKRKLLRVAVAASQRTIVEIATIPVNSSIGLICRSEKFLNIIKGNLSTLLPFQAKIVSLFEQDSIVMLEAIRELDVLIAAPDSIVFDGEQADRSAKHIIAFHYQIERGSMAYIEEQIHQIATGKTTH